MGISLQFSTKNQTSYSESTHISYSTCARIGDAIGIKNLLRKEYYVEISCAKIIHAMNNFLASYRLRCQEKIDYATSGLGYKTVEDNDNNLFQDYLFGDNTESSLVTFVRQIVDQYNTFVKDGNRPKVLIGA
jgi:hypothetical protein